MSPPQLALVADDTGSTQSDNLSTEAQAGSPGSLGAGDSSSTLGTTIKSAGSLSTVIHTGTPGSLHSLRTKPQWRHSSDLMFSPRRHLEHLHPAADSSSSQLETDNPNSHATDDLGDTPPANKDEDAALHPTRFPERPKGLPVVGKVREY
ncbi:hypothetical protein B0H19DRAFT_1273612 [Mycena capillaripes]|nr:hypothetical protein B0H19DRAFT_1273612 [Mycena capillaripes]